MQHITINGEVRFFEGAEGLLNLIQEKMGYDAGEEVKELIGANTCVGECDHTYKIHEHYTRVIRDALDELRNGRNREAIRLLEVEE